MYAPFEFALKKSPAQLQEEEARLATEVETYYKRDVSVINQVTEAYQKRFSHYFVDSIPKDSLDRLYLQGLDFIAFLYNKGVWLNDIQSNDRISVIGSNNEVVDFPIDSLVNLHTIEVTTNQYFSEFLDDSYKKAYAELFFEITLPNITKDQAFTQKALEERKKSIVLTRGFVERGQLIIAKGEVVEGNRLAMLDSLQEEFESVVWNANNYYWVLAGYTLLVALALFMLLLYLHKYRSFIYQNNTKVTLVFFNIVFMVFLTTLVVQYNADYVFVVPLCLLPLILKAFFDARTGLFTHVLTILLLGFVVPNSFQFIFLQIIAGIVTILTVSELYKRVNLFISVGQITAVYIVSFVAFHIVYEGTVSTLDYYVLGLFILNGLATLFAQPLIYIYEKVFGLVSDVSLLELSDTNSKIMKELAEKAPGTFHHSLQVANLAEAAANEIGANAMLVRVGALYHDIGKMENPMYFTENQKTSVNPHDEMDAYNSAQLIIKHVIDGIELARKYKLPDRIIDFIRTHHGTTYVYYFYKKQLESGDDFSEEDFRYPGPIPFSKETAILMIADSVEAASKSLKNPTYGMIEEFVERIVAKQIDEHQFENADITFREIQSVKKILVQKLTNIYHLRVEYPE